MNRPLSILFAADVPPDPDSGAAGTEFQTIEALRRLGHDVDALWADDLGRRIQHGNLHYLLELPLRYRNAIRRAAAGKTYDVFQVNQGHCYLAAKDHRRRGRKGVFVFRSHGLDDHMEQVLAPWRKKLGVPGRAALKTGPGRIIDRGLNRHIRLACRHADGILVSSGLDKAYLMDVHHLPANRVAAVSQAAPREFLETPPLPMNPGRSRKILFIGSAYWKGLHLVIPAINELARQAWDFTFTWICTPEIQEFARQQLDTAACEKTVFPNWISQANLIHTYDEHGILLCPSLFEGFCKVFMEGMSRGMCVIGTPTGGMRDIIKDGENGCVVDFHAPDQLAATVRSLIANQKQASDLSRRARSSALEYSWERTARETAAFYVSLNSRGS